MQKHNTTYARIHGVLDAVIKSEKSAFYANHFSASHFNIRAFSFLSALSSVPLLSSEKLATCPFAERTYRTSPLFMKVTRRENRAFLTGRTLDDIAQESYGPAQCERPLVAFEYTHESIEKGLWFYCRNILPLAGEDNAEITAITATKYRIDTITADTATLAAIAEPLLRRYDVPKRVRHITIIDTVFDTSFLKRTFAGIPATLVLGMSETGAIATNCPGDSNIFHPVDDSYVEIIDGEIVFTKLVMLPTPLIRYQTGIMAKSTPSDCQCTVSLSFTLTPGT